MLLTQGRPIITMMNIPSWDIHIPIRQTCYAVILSWLSSCPGCHPERSEGSLRQARYRSGWPGRCHVILSAAKDLFGRLARPFAALRACPGGKCPTKWFSRAFDEARLLVTAQNLQ